MNGHTPESPLFAFALPRFKGVDRVISWLIWLVVFQVYLGTECPTVYVGDSGELAIQPDVLTVAHPTGYPIFGLFGKLFLLLLPFGNVSYKMAIMSGFFSAASLIFLYAILRRLLGNRLYAAIPPLAFGLGFTLWSQAVVPEVYAINIFFLSVLTYLVLCWQDRPSARMLPAIAFIFALALGHHMTALLTFPALLLGLLSRQTRRSGLLKGVVTGRESYEKLKAARLPFTTTMVPMLGWAQTAMLILYMVSFPFQAQQGLSKVFFGIMASVTALSLIPPFLLSKDLRRTALQWIFRTGSFLALGEFAVLAITTSFEFLYHTVTFLVLFDAWVQLPEDPEGRRWPALKAETGKWWRPVLASVMAFIIGFSVYLYIPLRSLKTSPTNVICSLYWGDFTKYSEFRDHLSGKKFQSLMFTQKVPTVLEHFEHFLGFTTYQFTPIGFIFILLGFWVMARRNPQAFRFLGLTGFLVGWFCLNYEIVDIEVFFVPTFFVEAVAFGFGLHWVGEWATRKTLRGSLPGVPVRPAMAWGLLMLLLFPVLCYAANYHHNDRSRYFIAHDYGKHVFNTIRGQATLLTQGWITPYILGYLQTASRERQFSPEKVNMVIEGRSSVLSSLASGKFKLPTGFKVYTTVPLEINGIEKVFSEIRGLVYEVGLSDQTNMDVRKNYWGLYNDRDIALEDQSVSKDYQSRSLVAKYYYMQGDSEFEKGNIPEALKLCQRALDLSPGNKQVWNNLACIYFKRKLYDLAEEACKEALRIDPTFQQARHNLGNVYFKKGQFDIALEMFGANQRAHWGLEFYRDVVAQIFMKQGRYRDAIKEFKNAIRIDPANVDVYNSMAIAYLNDGDAQTARETLEKAARIAPKHAETYNNLGNVYESLGEWEKAEESFKKASELNPEMPDPWNNLGILYGQKKRIAESYAAFQKSLEIKPRYTTAMNNLGIALAQEGRLEEAVSWWQKSLSIDPKQNKIADYIRTAREQAATPSPAAPAE